MRGCCRAPATIALLMSLLRSIIGVHSLNEEPTRAGAVGPAAHGNSCCAAGAFWPRVQPERVGPAPRDGSCLLLSDLLIGCVASVRGAGEDAGECRRAYCSVLGTRLHMYT